MPKRNTPADLWARAVEVDGCWVWQGMTSKATGGRPYGRMWLGNVRWWAHRLAYTLAVGPIPTGLVIDHLCRNTLCIRPDHLEAVTNEENLARGINRQVTECPAGHAYTPENMLGGRKHCRACHNARARAKAAKVALVG